MADEEKNALLTEAEVGGGNGCPVEMHDGKPCGRPVYNALAGVDERPVCLMHSVDPDKDEGWFQYEFRRVLNDNSQGVADFTRFVFPSSYYSTREFSSTCLFRNAKFLKVANFMKASFARDADFSEAEFAHGAIFTGAAFWKKCHFVRCKFSKEARFSETDFRDAACFTEARFDGEASFSLAKFQGPVFFKKGSFSKKAEFSQSRFVNSADFTAVKFAHDADFTGANFHLGGDFTEAEFGGAATFRRAKFKGDAKFYLGRFLDSADFTESTFGAFGEFSRAKFCRGSFERATFKGQATFEGSEFTKETSFFAARFAGPAGFIRAIFLQSVDFTGAEFAREAYFNSARFAKQVCFRWAAFKGRADFLSASFREDETLEPGPVFSLARFERAEEVNFYSNYLGQALFHNCDVSRMTFITVGWRARHNSAKRMIFEQDVDLTLPFASDLKPAEGSPDERNYDLISVTYQQLKKNYDDRRDYWTAGDWHYGEMETKRLTTPSAGGLLRRLEARRMGDVARLVWRAKQVWHSHFGVAAWYKYASEYGESYTRPLACLAALVLAAFLVYPSIGLRYSSAHSETTGAAVKWLDRCPDPSSYHTCMGVWRLAGNSLLTSVEVAAFQRELAYEPVYPWGRLARLVELVLTSTLLALFLLALRRQFRR
jgi:Pentapeptide repeats (9 copies)